MFFKFCGPSGPRCDVDAVAKDIVVVDDDVADVNADPEFDPEIVRHVGVLRGHASLDFPRAVHRLHRAGELDQHAVAGGLDNAAAMRGDLRIEQRLPTPLQIGERAFFVTAHQTAVAGDIRRQHSRQPSFNALAGQKMPLGSVIQPDILDLISLRSNFFSRNNSQQSLLQLSGN
jgi:hypothetical protein